MRFKKLASAVCAVAMAASVMAGLAVTASAAVTPYSQDYEASGVVCDWDSNNTGRYTASIGGDSTNHYLSIAAVGNGNNGTTANTNASYTGKVDAGTDFTMTFDIQINSGTNQSNTDFQIKSADGYILDFKQKAAGANADYIINGNEGQTVHFNNDTWYKVQLTRSGSKNYLTINNADNSELFAREAITSGSANGGITGMYFATGRYYASLKMDNIVIRDVEASDLPSTPQGDFTVQYITTEGSTLNKTSSGSGDAGSVPVLSTNDKAAFKENDQKYIYVSDNAADVKLVQNETVTVTVTVRKAATYTVTVDAVIGSETKSTLGTYNVFEGDSVTYYYPKYLTDANGCVIGSINSTYATKTPTATQIYTVDYTAYTGTAQFIEGESFMGGDLSPSGTGASAGYGKRVSDTAESAITVAKDGVYTVTTAAFCRNTGNKSIYTVYANDTAIAENIDAKGHSQNGPAVNIATGVTLSAGDVIKISGDSGQTYLDYVLIELEDAEIVDVNVTESTIPDGADLTLVSGTETDKPIAGTAVTNYLVKVKNGSSSMVPTLATPTAGAESLTPTASQDVIYGYAGSNGYYYFVIQTIGIDRATAASVNGHTYTIAAAE